MIKEYTDGRVGFEVEEEPVTVDQIMEQISASNLNMADVTCLIAENWKGILSNHNGSLDAAMNSGLDIIEYVDTHFNNFMSATISAAIPFEAKVAIRQMGKLPPMDQDDLQQLTETGGYFDLSETTKERVYAYVSTL